MSEELYKERGRLQAAERTIKALRKALRTRDAELAQSRDHIIEQERGIVGRENRICELEQQVAESVEIADNALFAAKEYEKKLTTIKEKASAAVQYEDILDIGLAEALKELAEALPPP